MPKRVLNTHGGLRNLLLWMQANYRLDARDRVLHHTPVTFDASLAEIFLPLIVGARLVIAKPDGHRDAAYLVRTIAEQSITQIVHVVPSMLQSWLAEPGFRHCVALRTGDVRRRGAALRPRSALPGHRGRRAVERVRPRRGRRHGHLCALQARCARPVDPDRAADRQRPASTSSTPISNRCRWACRASCTSAVPAWAAATSASPT